MKVNKRRMRLSKRSKATLALCVALLVTLCLGYLGLNGTPLDSRGLWKLLPWIPTPNVENWPGALALDFNLEGGVFVEYEVIANEEETAESADFNALLDSTINIMRDRLAQKGLIEATVAKLGENHIRVEIPSVSDLSATLDMIGAPAKLAFLDPDGTVFMENRHIKSAAAMWDANANPAIALTLTGEGAELFGDMTAANIGKTTTVTLDGVALMTPSISEPIYGGTLSLTSPFSPERTQNFAIQLQSGSYPLNLQQSNIDIISAPLGMNALATLVRAATIGILLVLLLLVIRYRLSGLFASWSVCLFLILLFLLVAAVPGIQLTLPGLIGILIAIFLNVDANVLALERVTDEARAGVAMIHAVRNGFKTATKAILNANIALLVASIVLLLCGSGTLQGFATMLLLGVLVNLFSIFVISSGLLTHAVRIMPAPALYAAGTSKQNANEEAK